MSDATAEEAAPEGKKPSKLPMMIGILLAVVGAGGGFFAVQSGLLGGGGDAPAAVPEVTEEVLPETAPLPAVAFVEVPQITVSLGPNSAVAHLRFRASLEVPAAHEAEVQAILPRVQDVLNSYLRALEPADVKAQGALVRLRGQMLRRVKLVAGEGRVRDLLVLEFVLN